MVLPISDSRRASQVRHAIVRTRSVLLLLRFIAAEMPLFIYCRLADIKHRSLERVNVTTALCGVWVHMYICTYLYVVGMRLRVLDQRMLVQRLSRGLPRGY